MAHPHSVLLAIVAGTVLANTAAVEAQGDPALLRINEVIADNATGPIDFGGGTPDAVEIYNTGDERVDLAGLALSDSFSVEEAIATRDLYLFPDDLRVEPKSSIIIFCDEQASLRCIEPHANFQIDADGNEPITLWGPENDSGEREVIDQVMLPPLRRDVSFGRFPDGAGPAPVPLEATFDVFHFNAPGTQTFGRCTSTGFDCGGGQIKRLCEGGENGPGANLEPRVSRRTHDTNSPGTGERIGFTVKVRDDKAPVPPNIASVEIVYRLTRGGMTTDWLRTPMTFDESLGEGGVLTGADTGHPLDRWSVWSGEIPPQDEPARVEFYFEVTDAEGASSTRPRELCFDVLTDELDPRNPICDVRVDDASGIGPCDAQFGGPGCLAAPCRPDHFVPCDAPFTLAVGYEPRDTLGAIVINEVMARQFHDPAADPPISGVLRDPTATDPSLCGFADAKYCCRTGEDPPTCGYDDYVELVNTSDAEIDLSGLYLSDSFFRPQIFRFPPGSLIAPGEHLLIWADDDGGKCPDPFRPVEDMPGFWECPDPNDPASGQLHTNFELNGDRDQVFLYDTEENHFGLIAGVTFENQVDNVSLSVCPDGARSGTLVQIDGGTPGAPNECAIESTFRRGDTNNDGAVDISDGVATLNFLFQGGDAPVCAPAADFNGDGPVDISDAVATFNHLFLGGPPAAPPFPDCGVDPDDPGISCPESVCNA